MTSVDNPKSLSSLPIQAFMDPSEWYEFYHLTAEVASQFPDITGVLAIGSLMQSFRPPASFYVPRRNGPLGLAYEEIRNPDRRKVFPGNDSDLDIWVAVEDTSRSEEAESAVDLGGIALLEELALGEVSRGKRRWHDKKQAAFGGNYKKRDLYPFRFSFGEDAPWLALQFKTLLERELARRTPDFVDRVNNFTAKKIPGNFIEVRAFPQSLFHLRPDDVEMKGGLVDRQPFPRIADDQWISPAYTSTVLYSTEAATVYPFRSNGRILGSSIDQYIRNREPASGQSSYGAFLIKPDAIEAGELSRIVDKIKTQTAVFGGRVILERMFNPLSRDQIVGLYPTLSGQDLEDAIRYLSSGACIGIVIEGPLPLEEMMTAVNTIKGPRVADRTLERLTEGRITDGSIRDLLPLPGDEERYLALFPGIHRRRVDVNHRFTQEEYAYYSRNLVHSPDNQVELWALLNLMGIDLQYE